MAMTVTLKLSPEAEAKLRESIAEKDAEAAQQVLTESLSETIADLLRTPDFSGLEQKRPDQLSVEEFEALADELADEVEKMIPPGTPPLSEYALSRESFYEDHPKL